MHTCKYNVDLNDNINIWLYFFHFLLLSNCYVHHSSSSNAFNKSMEFLSENRKKKSTRTRNIRKNKTDIFWYRTTKFDKVRNFRFSYESSSNILLLTFV